MLMTLSSSCAKAGVPHSIAATAHPNAPNTCFMVMSFMLRKVRTRTSNARSGPAALPDVGEREVEALADQRDHLVELRDRHHQRRRDDHPVADGAHDQPV